MAKSPHPNRIFKTPEDLRNAWLAFKVDVKERSKEWVKVQYVGKEGERKEDPQKIPLTLDGFEVFCVNNYGNVSQYFDNKDGYYDEFVAICSHIRKEIRENQIIGGMLGFFNPSITQRLNSLNENINNNITIDEKLTKEEAIKRAKELDEEF